MTVDEAVGESTAMAATMTGIGASVAEVVVAIVTVAGAVVVGASGVADAFADAEIAVAVIGSCNGRRRGDRRVRCRSRHR